MKMYGVLLIGCGHIGEEHLKDIYYRENIRVLGIVDKDIQLVHSTAGKYGIPSYGMDYHPYLELEDVNIVIIATYTSSHLRILTDCLDYGKHVICEKPMGRNEEEGEAFLQAVRESHSKVMLSYVLRYNRTYQKVSELIRSGVIGDVRVCRMVQNHHCKDWERYKRLLKDCSPIVDCGVHYADVICWFTGAAITKIDGFGARIDEDLPQGAYNYGMVTMELDNGTVGYYEAAWSKVSSSCNVKEFIGTKGRISITLNSMRYKDHEEGDLIELYISENNEYRMINMQSTYKNMWGQLQGLIAMIEEDLDCCARLEEEWQSFRMLLKADRIIRDKL